MDDRLTRESAFWDELVLTGCENRGLIGRFSEAFYEKGSRGRLWGPFWETSDLKGATVLDYCCGEGKFSLRLAGMGAQVTGVDISPKLIELARASASKAGMNGSSPKFMVGDAHQTAFKDDSFDFVLGNGALHHLDLDLAIAEIARILKPGGKAVFVEPMYHHPMVWLLRRLTPNSHTADERPLSLGDLEKPKKCFRACSHREHFLFAVCAAPAHLLGKKFALSVVDRMDRFDERLMNAQPRLRRFAWYSMIEMEK